MARAFASDNWSGVHPRVMEALVRANEGHVPAYGDDPLTAHARQRFGETFGDDAEVFFVFTGTGANVLALDALARPYHSVLCADVSHIATDECSAPERFTGCKLETIPTVHGKLTPDALRPRLKGFGVVHHAQPGVLSLTQATEMGTVYTLDETRALAGLAHDHGMRVHMDGARLANAAVTLDKPLRALTRDAGVDALSFGGTKNGLMGAEAVVLFDPELARDFGYRRKQGMQLPSKMRFLAAQFAALLEDDLWKQNAAAANRAAALLARLAANVPGVEIVHPVEANEVFARVPRAVCDAVREQVPYYVWDEHEDVVRWVCSFDTTEDDVRDLARRLQDAAEGAAPPV